MGLEDFLTINRKNHEFLKEIPSFHLLSLDSLTPEFISRTVANRPPGTTSTEMLELLGGRKAYLEKHQSVANVPFILPYYVHRSDLANFDFVHVHPSISHDKKIFQTTLYDIAQGKASVNQFLSKGLENLTTVFTDDDFVVDIPRDLQEETESGHNRTLYTSMEKTIEGNRKTYHLTARVIQGFHAVAQRLSSFQLQYWIHLGEKLDPRIDPTGKFEVCWKNGNVITHGLAARVNLNSFTFHTGVNVSDGIVYWEPGVDTSGETELSSVLYSLLELFRSPDEKTLNKVANLSYVR